MRALSLALLALLLVATSADRAAGAPPSTRRVAVLAPAPAWLDALRVALSPWQIEIVAVEGDTPPTDPGAAADAARQLAATADADVLMWIGRGATGGAWLWLYDRDTDQLSVRPLPAGPPDTAETATAAALTAKTMIRLTRTAPPPQRFGASPARPPTRWRVVVGFDHRQLAAGPTDETLTFLTAGLAWWPASLAGRVGLTGQLSSGPGFAIADQRLIARFTRSSLGASVHGALRVGHGLRLEAIASFGLHFTALDGTAPMSATAIATSRTNASIGAAAAIVVPVGGGVELAVSLGVDLALRRQRYLLGGEPILELPAAEPLLGLHVSVPIR